MADPFEALLRQQMGLPPVPQTSPWEAGIPAVPPVLRAPVPSSMQPPRPLQSVPIPASTPAPRQSPRPATPPSSPWGPQNEPFARQQMPAIDYRPQKYTDPVYDTYEAQASDAHGVPRQYLQAIRLHGERSNPDQVSSAGARSAYQFIPETRAGIVKNYGVDPYAGEAQAAEAAALLLKENFKWARSLGLDGDQAWRKAIQAYHGGRDPSRYGKENAGYVTRTGAFLDQLGGLPGGGVGSGFDPSLFNPALASLGQAEAAAMTPWSETVNQQPRPDMPGAPPEVVKKDFGAQEELMEQLKPQAFGEEESGQLKRRRLWQGAAQALASLPESAGVGQIFAKVGAGMLGGRLSADDEIQARADAYDEKMQQYNQLKLNFEDEKAERVAAEANQEAANAYGYAWRQFDQKMQTWSQNNSVSVQNGQLMVTSTDDNGSMTISGTPIQSLTVPQYAMQRAGIQADIAGGQNSANVGMNHLVNSAVVGAALKDGEEEVFMDRSQQSQAGVGPAVASATFAGDIVRGGFAGRVIGEENWARLQEDAAAHASQHARGGDDAYSEAYNDYITGQMTQVLIENQVARRQASQFLPGLQVGRDAAAERTRRTDDKGRTTETVRY